MKYLTFQGLKDFKKELEYLEKVKRKEVSKRLREAASQGDLSENAGYDMAKEEQSFLEGRIKEIREIISQAKIIEKKENDKVEIGSFVVLEGEGEKETFQIVESEEADIFQGKISLKSPLGEAILGKRKGEVVGINTPQGEKKYKVIDFN